jgi:hypothetical protein
MTIKQNSPTYRGWRQNSKKINHSKKRLTQESGTFNRNPSCCQAKTAFQPPQKNSPGKAFWHRPPQGSFIINQTGSGPENAGKRA